MNILNLEHISKIYGDKTIFNDASLGIHEGDKIGVLGINGTGKSTLLKIAAGLEEPDQGEVVKARNLNICYLPQNPAFNEAHTVLEAVLDGIKTKDNEWTIESEAKTLLTQLDISEYDQPVKNLSGGQRKRIALVRSLLGDADLLILDEPTNHLDNRMSEWLENYLSGFRGTLVMVTHDRYFLDRVCSRIVEVDHGSIYNYPGNYSEYLHLKDARINMELASERKRQSIMKKELEWLARGARARSTKQKAHIDRIEQLVNQEGPRQEKTVELDSVASRMGKKTIIIDEISKNYGTRTLIRNFSYIFLKDDRIGIIGPNGCGKSTLMKIINQIVPADHGSIEIGQTIKIGYFSQENEYMDERLKAIEYVREGAEYIETPDGKITVSQMLERFLFDGSMQWSVIEKLSGGEKRRLYLLRILMEAPNVLILDEPTNDLDIQTLTILEDYLDNFNGIVITVSHDRYFLDRIVSRIFAFEEAGAVQQYEGSYSDYLAAYEVRHPKEEIRSVKEKTVDSRKSGERKIKFSYGEMREFEAIDDDIAAIEAQIDQLEQKIADSASSYMQLSELMEEKAERESALEEKMDRWVYLNDLAEQIEHQKN